MLLLPMLYMPPLSYMALLSTATEVYIEAQESYIKSTYRNKCEILGANGRIVLSIPLTGGRDHHQLYKEAQIAYADDWQHRHYMSIISAYGSAPFYEHYIDHFKPFYEQQYGYLFEYNTQLLQLLIRLLKLDVKIRFTTEYQKEVHGAADMRKLFKAGQKIEAVPIGQKKWHLREVPYIQVFSGSGSFEAQVTVLDLLFNTGPEAKHILRAMIEEL